ncbi:UNVERIFIED_CONTAM: hypothetical protein HHA_309070 [Hammondia hammondi]|eukprot:XP_008888121.1 hypothetical protein HHA_309070 [Hammondia hammondi]
MEQPESQQEEANGDASPRDLPASEANCPANEQRCPQAPQAACASRPSASRCLLTHTGETRKKAARGCEAPTETQACFGENVNVAVGAEGGTAATKPAEGHEREESESRESDKAAPSETSTSPESSPWGPYKQERHSRENSLLSPVTEGAPHCADADSPKKKKTNLSCATLPASNAAAGVSSSASVSSAGVCASCPIPVSSESPCTASPCTASPCTASVSRDEAGGDVSAFFTIEVEGDASLEAEVLSSVSSPSPAGQDLRPAVEAETARWRARSPGLGAAYALLHARLLSKLVSLGAVRGCHDTAHEQPASPSPKRRRLEEKSTSLLHADPFKSSLGSVDSSLDGQPLASPASACERYEICQEVLSNVVREAQAASARACQGGWSNCIRRVFARSGGEKESRYYFSQDGSPRAGGRRPLLSSSLRRSLVAEEQREHGRDGEPQKGRSTDECVETEAHEASVSTLPRNGESNDNHPSEDSQSVPSPSPASSSSSASASSPSSQSLGLGSSLRDEEAEKPFCVMPLKSREERACLAFTWKEWETHHVFVLATHQSSTSICYFCGRRACPRSEDSRTPCPATRCERCCQRGHRASRQGCSHPLDLLHRIEEAFEARFEASLRDDREDIRCIRCGGRGHFICGEAPASEGFSTLSLRTCTNTRNRDARQNTDPSFLWTLDEAKRYLGRLPPSIRSRKQPPPPPPPSSTLRSEDFAWSSQQEQPRARVPECHAFAPRGEESHAPRRGDSWRGEREARHREDRRGHSARFPGDGYRRAHAVAHWGRDEERRDERRVDSREKERRGRHCDADEDRWKEDRRHTPHAGRQRTRLSLLTLLWLPSLLERVQGTRRLLVFRHTQAPRDLAKTPSRGRRETGTQTRNDTCLPLPAPLMRGKGVPSLLTDANARRGSSSENSQRVLLPKHCMHRLAPRMRTPGECMRLRVPSSSLRGLRDRTAEDWEKKSEEDGVKEELFGGCRRGNHVPENAGAPVSFER